jgi:hypothetical protein
MTYAGIILVKTKMSFDPTDDLLFVAKEVAGKTGFDVNVLLNIASERKFINKSYIDGISALQGGDGLKGGMQTGNQREESRNYFRSCYEVFLFFGVAIFGFFALVYFLSISFEYLYDNYVRDPLSNNALYSLETFIMVSNIFTFLVAPKGWIKTLFTTDYLQKQFLENLNFGLKNLGFGGLFLLAAYFHYRFIPNYSVLSCFRRNQRDVLQQGIAVFIQDPNVPRNVRLQGQRFLNNITGNRSATPSRGRSATPQRGAIVPVARNVQTGRRSGSRGRSQGRGRTVANDGIVTQTTNVYVLPTQESTPSSCVIQGGKFTNNLLYPEEEELLQSTLDQIIQNLLEFVGYDKESNTFSLASIDIEQLEGGGRTLISAQQIASALLFIVMFICFDLSMIFIGSNNEINQDSLSTILGKRLFQIGNSNATLKYNTLNNKFEIITPSKAETFSILFDRLTLQEVLKKIEKNEVIDLQDFFLTALSTETSNTLRQFISEVGFAQGISFDIVNVDQLKNDSISTIVNALEGNSTLQILTKKANLEGKNFKSVISSLVNVTIDGVAEKETLESLRTLLKEINNLPLAYADSPLDLDFVQGLLNEFKQDIDVNFKFSEILNPQTGLPITELQILSTIPGRFENFLYPSFGIVRIDENFMKNITKLTLETDTQKIREKIGKKIVSSKFKYEVGEKERELLKYTGSFLKTVAQAVNSGLSAFVVGEANYILTQNAVGSVAAAYGAYQTSEAINSFQNSLQTLGLSITGLLTPIGLYYAFRYFLSFSDYFDTLTVKNNWKFFILLSILTTGTLVCQPEIKAFLQTPEAQELKNYNFYSNSIASLGFNFDQILSFTIVPSVNTSMLTLEDFQPTETVLPSDIMSTQIIPSSLEVSTSSTSIDNSLDIFADNSLITYNSTSEKFQIQLPEDDNLTLTNIVSVQPTYTVREFSISELSRYLYETYNIKQLLQIIGRIQQKIQENNDRLQTISNVSPDYNLITNNTAFLEKVLEGAVTAYTRKRTSLNVPLEIAAPSLSATATTTPTVVATTTIVPTISTTATATPTPTETINERLLKIEELIEYRRRQGREQTCIIM